jgi:hypothetical protein
MHNNQLIYIITGTIIFFIFVLPLLDNMNNYQNNKIKEKYSDIKSEQNLIKGIDTKKCSKDCCNFTQYPVPHMKPINNEYVGSNFFCNLGSGSGCPCIKKEDIKLLTLRGNNKKYY